jgi:hypothetical protein
LEFLPLLVAVELRAFWYFSQILIVGGAMDFGLCGAKRAWSVLHFRILLYCKLGRSAVCGAQIDVSRRDLNARLTAHFSFQN